jgi:hypothetical protein
MKEIANMFFFYIKIKNKLLNVYKFYFIFYNDQNIDIYLVNFDKI